MSKPVMSAEREPIIPEREQEVGLVSYSFTIGEKTYFLPHTPEAPFWEVMEDLGDEYRTVCHGVRAVATFVRKNNIQNILVNNQLPLWHEEM